MLIALLKVGILEMKYTKIKLYAFLAAIGLSAAALSGCKTMTPASAGTSAADINAADTSTAGTRCSDTSTAADSSEEEPAAAARDDVRAKEADVKDGVYKIRVDSSSSMFRITDCELTVQDGIMSAVMTMSGTGYLKLYMGTGDEAEQASEADFIPFVEHADGRHTFKVPVEALDKEIDCAAFSKKKEKWYDRVLVFRSDSLPAEAFDGGQAVTAESLKLDTGSYTVAVRLEGGSGRASVQTPAALRVEDNKAYAVITWSSSNYDYMKVDGEKFDLINTEGNSSFEIPVSVFDRKMPVIADTIAMSEPHEVEYTLVFDSTTIKKAE